MAGSVPEPSPLTYMGSDRAVARRVARPMQRFLHIEAASGILLIIATVIAMVWANSPAKDSYFDLWGTEIVIELGDVLSLEGHEEAVETEAGETEGGSAAAGGETETGGEATGAEGEDEAESEEPHGITLQDLVNDALMAIFFFVVGMEIKMELVRGQLRDRRAAALPAMAALGGMVVPALFYVAFNLGGDIEGWGIPMATDIAFAVGVVSLLGNRVPSSLKVFLLTLAIVDDIGAILVIAIFYTESLSFGWLALAIGLVGFMYFLQRIRVWYLPIYVVVGAFVWFAVFESGVHATIAGVLMGLLTPAVPLQRDTSDLNWVDSVVGEDDTGVSGVRRAEFQIRETVPVAERLIEILHPWTSFVIIPIFALANAGIELSQESLESAATSPVTIGVVLGLVVGKLVGVTVFTWIATATGLSSLPEGVNFAHIRAIAAVAGIGFTVSIFITGLAFSDPVIQDEAKIGILVASALAAAIGLYLLSRACRPDMAEIEGGLEQSADF